MASSIDFIAGCVGGAAGVIVGHPLDTVKVMMQTSAKQISAMSIMRTNSLSSLYRGIKAPLSSLAVINALGFGVHGSIMRSRPETLSESRRALWSCVAGCAAGLCQTLLTCPMELVKTRSQLSQQTTLDCLRHTFRHEGGLRALYRGFGVTVVRDVPAFAIYFLSYDLLLSAMQQAWRGGTTASTVDVMLAGGTAGALSWLIVYPIDVVKSRLQADLRYTSTRHCIQHSWRTEGARVFTRGCSTTLLRAFPVNAVTFAVVAWTLYFYEQSRTNTGQRERDQRDNNQTEKEMVID